MTKLLRQGDVDVVPRTSPWVIAPVITPDYERQADPVIELQLEKAGVRLAYLLDAVLGAK